MARLFIFVLHVVDSLRTVEHPAVNFGMTLVKQLTNSVSNLTQFGPACVNSFRAAFLWLYILLFILNYSFDSTLACLLHLNFCTIQLCGSDWEGRVGTSFLNCPTGVPNLPDFAERRTREERIFATCKLTRDQWAYF